MGQDKLLASVDRNTVHFNPQDIASTLLAVNQMGLKWVDIDRNLQDKLLASVDRNTVHFNSQDIANTLFALDGLALQVSDLRHAKKSLLDAVTHLCSKFESRDILTCVEALDHIGFFWKDFPEILHTTLFNTIKRKYYSLKG